jgi:hypothetical protein
MVICFAAGNAGPGSSTVGSPATAKNVLCVGAEENVHSHSAANGGNDPTGTDDCGSTDADADSAADIASFSSRGPCADGRQKPDLVAPGTHITGGVGQSVLTSAGSGTAIPCFDAVGVTALLNASGCGFSPTIGNPNNYFPLGQEFYTTSTGTSHAAPGVAGACALLRQYFINAALAPPSPAMTKAFLVNSTRYLTGTYAGDTLPSPNQGMGAVNLGTAFDGVPRVLRDQLPADKFTASGQTRTVNGVVADGGNPFRVTLAWTDAPGSTIGNAYNNDLDLAVTIGGVTYQGNVFSGGTSVAGGTADGKNNLESVFLPAGASGSFVVTVTAANLNSDGVPNEAPAVDQDYALVIYNATETDVPVITTEPQSQTVSLGSPASFNVAVSTATAPGFQWYFNAAALADATNSSYTLGSVGSSNAGDYTVIVTNIHGSATSAVATLMVAVAPLITTNPASLTVVTGSTANFTVTALGAPPLSYQWQFNGSNIADATTNAYSLPSAQSSDAGEYSVVVSNYAGSVTSAPATLTVSSWSARGVVISQVYGGGGSVGAVYQNDYVELFNASTEAVNLSSWSVQYASAAGTTWSVTSLTGGIAPAGHYLIRLASNGANGSVLPAADRTNTAVNLSSANGKVALVTNQTALTGGNPVGASAVKDFVGFGSANAFEGGAAAPTGSVTTAILRRDGGATDTDNNAADFTSGTPSPHSSVTPNAILDLAILLSHSGSFTQGDTGRVYTIVVTNVGSLVSTSAVSVVETLPAGLTAVEFTGSGWTTSLSPLTATRTDELATNAAYPALTLTVNVASNAPAVVTNLATLTTDGDQNPSNDSASDVTSIIATSGGGNYTGVLAGWDVNGVTGFGGSPQAPSTNAPYVMVGGLTRGAGVTTNLTAASRAWGGNGFNATSETAAVAAGDYVTFSLTANPGYQLSLSAVSRFDYRRSSSGPTSGVLQYQVGAGAFVSLATNTYSTSSSSGAVLPALDLNAIAALQNVGAGTNVTFRIVNFGALSADGTWYVYDYASSTAPDLAVSGSVAPPPGPPPTAPTLTLFSVTEGQMQFTLTGTAGSNYVIEVTPTLEWDAWSPVHTGAAPILFIEPATEDQRYYRGKVWP